MTIELELVNQPVIAGARPVSMSQRVYDTVRNAIVQLQLRPGHLLSEAELARYMGCRVSRCARPSSSWRKPGWSRSGRSAAPSSS